MELARRMYSRDLKIAAMREIETRAERAQNPTGDSQNRTLALYANSRQSIVLVTCAVPGTGLRLHR
jgi:hypothetical protein